MASPVVVEAVESSTPTAGTSHVVTHPTVVASELWLLILDKGSTSATVNAHADWTELLDEAVANGLYIAYRWTTGAEGASTTLVTSASTRSAQMVYRITGAENPATTAPQIGTTATGTSATPNPPASATPPSSKDYLFITFYGAAGEEADDDTWSDTSPTNYTPSPPRMKACGIAGSNLGGLIAAAERALTTGVAENPGTFAKDVSVAWRAQTITVHPSTSNPQLVTPGTVALVLAAFAPTILTPILATIVTAALTLSTFAPVVTASDHQTATPATASLALTTFAPTVGIGVVATPPTVALTTAAFAPVVTATQNQTVTPDTASLTTSLFAPTVTATDHKTAVPETAALTTATFAPTVTATENQIVTPSTAALSTSTFAPTVTASDHKLVTPGTAALSTSAFAPTVTASDNQTVTPSTAALSTSAFAPAIAVTDNKTVTPSTATLSTVTFAPTASAGEEQAAAPGRVMGWGFFTKLPPLPKPQKRRKKKEEVEQIEVLADSPRDDFTPDAVEPQRADARFIRDPAAPALRDEEDEFRELVELLSVIEAADAFNERRVR